MKIAILTFPGFNELDSFIALGILNRIKHMKYRGWSVQITSPSTHLTSMNNVAIERQQPLDFANQADVVLFGSGAQTLSIAQDQTILSALQLNPTQQLIGAQCSGTLLMAKLGLIGSLPACTDLTTKPWVEEAGVNVINAPFYAHENISTAGGCMSSQYLAAWVIAKLTNKEDAADAIHYVAPVGQKQEYVQRVMDVIDPFV